MSEAMIFPEAIRELITIQKPKAAAVPDDLGRVDPANADNWETHTITRAEVTETGSALARRVGVTREETTHVIRMLFCAANAGITGDMRVIRRGGAVLAIVAKPRDPDSLRRELVLEAVAGSL